MRAGLTDSSSTSRGSRISAGVHEPIETQRHGRLEADDAERRAVELDVLLVVVVRRVIGGDHVDAAVGDARRASRRDRRARAAAGSSSRWCRRPGGRRAPRR